jgi:hypothetical protein
MESTLADVEISRRRSKVDVDFDVVVDFDAEGNVDGDVPL